MSDYYTRTGDDGTSGLLGDTRVPKDHPRLEAIGAIDEANAAFGMARANSLNPDIIEIIKIIQRDLYKIMAEVAATPENATRFREIGESRIIWLEEQTEMIGKKLKMPKDFILPGDTKASASLDLARTIIRRAERRISSLFQRGELENPDLLRYINRLSSFCFVLELWDIKTSSTSPLTIAKETKP